MNIKQSFFVILIFFGFSFSAFSGIYKITSGGSNSHLVERCLGYSIGDSFDSSSMPSVEGKTFYSSPYSFECKSSFLNGSSLYVDVQRDDRRQFSGMVYLSSSGSCPDGQKVNPQTGKCEDAPPFCSRPDTIQKMNDFSSSCSAQGDGYQSNIICRDEDEYLEMNCDAPPPPPDECTPDSPDWPNCKPPTECTPDMPEYPSCCDESNNYCDNPPPEECTIFSPNWPECSGDTDIDPDTGDDLGDPDKPPGGGSGDPDPDKPEPDVEDNAEALGAISDLNKDMNKQLTAINNDLNKNHAESKSALDALKESIDLNTDTVVDSANHIKNAIESQTGTLSDIGNQSNKLLNSLNHLVNSGIGELSGDLSDIEGAINTGLDDLEDGINGDLTASDCKAFSCEGNAATCYLARKAWLEGCESKDLGGLEGAGDELLNSLGDYNNQFIDENGAYKGIYTDAEGSVSDLLKAYDESNGVNFDGQCPAPKNYNGGLFTFTIDLSPFCEMAYIIRACIMAAAAFGSFMMISKFI